MSPHDIPTTARLSASLGADQSDAGSAGIFSRRTNQTWIQPRRATCETHDEENTQYAWYTAKRVRRYQAGTLAAGKKRVGELRAPPLEGPRAAATGRGVAAVRAARGRGWRQAVLQGPRQWRPPPAAPPPAPQGAAAAPPPPRARRRRPPASARRPARGAGAAKVKRKKVVSRWNRGDTIALNIHMIALNIHTIALNIHTITLNIHTIALNIHTTPLNIHTIALNIHTMALRRRTSRRGSSPARRHMRAFPVLETASCAKERTRAARAGGGRRAYIPT
eukprot:609645-Prorocentrum_minimum.AAC.1